MGNFMSDDSDSDNSAKVAQEQLQREINQNKAEIARQTQQLNLERFKIVKTQGAQRWNPDPFTQGAKIPEKGTDRTTQEGIEKEVFKKAVGGFVRGFIRSHSGQ